MIKLLQKNGLYFQVFIFIILTGCIPMTPIVKITQSSQKSELEYTNQWLSGIPCELPCWEGVTPGHTSSQEAISIWGNNPLFMNVFLSTKSLGPTGERGIIEFQMNIFSNQFTGRAFYFTKTDLIEAIILTGSYNVTLDELINAFGSPEGVIASFSPYSEDVWYLYVMWISKGLYLLRDQFGKPLDITDDLYFPKIVFLSPGIEKFTSTELSKNEDGKLFPIKSWHGYASIDSYMSIK